MAHIQPTFLHPTTPYPYLLFLSSSYFSIHLLCLSLPFHSHPTSPSFTQQNNRNYPMDSGMEESQPKDWITLNYWSARLRPLWVAPSPEGSPYNPSPNTNMNTGHETFVVICNRSGEENGRSHDTVCLGENSLIFFHRNKVCWYFIYL